MTIDICIDPGVGGAIAWRQMLGSSLARNCPDTPLGQIDLLRGLKADAELFGLGLRCVVEEVGYMPGDGGRGVWTFASNDATWWAGLLALGIPCRRVRPQKWQKFVGGLPKDYDDRKRALKAFSQARWPDVKVTLANADALAMLAVFEKLWD